MRKFEIKEILFSAFIVNACSFTNEKSEYESLMDYNGKYEYTNPKSLVLSVSNFDTTLYAILDDAKYPLKHVGKDTFENSSKTPLIFQREKSGKVTGYVYE